MAKTKSRADFENITKAEEMIFADGFEGMIDLGEKLPDLEILSNAQKSDITIRAGIIRSLLLGILVDDHGEAIDLPPSGLQINGAIIEGELDLSFCEGLPAIMLAYCLFKRDINLNRAKLKLLVLSGSHIEGLSADRAVITGSVFMKKLEAQGEVWLLGAKIGRQLAMQNAKLHCAERSFSADGAVIAGNVFMQSLEAQGEVRLLGAKIGGQLAMQNAKLHGAKKLFIADRAVIAGSVFMKKLEAKGEVRLLGAKIGGNLEMQDAKLNGGISLQNAQTKGLCFFQGVNFGSRLEATVATLGVIVDDKASWPEKGKLILRGATYSGFQGDAPNTAKARLDWLDRMDKFHPQPYRQLAKVFRENGQDRDARAVLYAMEDKLRHALVADRGEPTGFSVWLIYDFLGVFKRVVGFGYRVHYALWWSLGFVVIMCGLIQSSYANSRIAPNSAVMINSPSWAKAYDSGLERSSAIKWTGDPTNLQAQEWETFNPVIYALDVYLPVVDLGQETAWAPVKVGVGTWAYYAKSIVKLAGWIISLLTIAAVTGVMQRRNEE